MKGNALSIWFLIGLLLSLYGVLITASGLYRLLHPPETLPVLGHLHADLVWGLVLLVVGLAYAIRFRPGR